LARLTSESRSKRSIAAATSNISEAVIVAACWRLDGSSTVTRTVQDHSVHEVSAKRESSFMTQESLGEP